jgi:hypothetical protein
MAVFIAIGAALIGVALLALFMPKPKAPKPPEATDLENPVAEAGKPIPVVFGTITVKGLNVLWYGNKSHETKKVKA